VFCLLNQSFFYGTKIKITSLKLAMPKKPEEKTYPNGFRLSQLRNCKYNIGSTQKKVGCGCRGDNTVYGCDLYSLCTLIKTKKEYKHCSSCKDCTPKDTVWAEIRFTRMVTISNR